MTKAPRRSPKVPRIDPRAYHGPLGEIVRQLAPTTEADPVGVLASLLAYVGTMIGDGPHVRVGNRPQPARIWPLLLGATGSGRKGTATADAESVVTAFDSYFLQECQVSGLSTGEGLIHRLRDRDGDDAGATDKRLLVIESEFARVLGITRREGNTLSEVLRGMWESGAAAVLTRGQPLACTGAHVSIIGHVTQRELRIKLAERDVAGGLVNRFLPLVVDRSQLLPYEVDSPDLRAVTGQVQRRIAAARKVGRVRRTPAAEDLWGDAYLALNDDRHDGPLGEVIARGALHAAYRAAVRAPRRPPGDRHRPPPRRARPLAVRGRLGPADVRGLHRAHRPGPAPRFPGIRLRWPYSHGGRRPVRSQQGRQGDRRAHR
ncbi:MAG: hypothetical protein M3P96_11025 [Actinomycetota bacterium]|nr:hypothetical protein [Actinomycetota bacterium]